MSETFQSTQLDTGFSTRQIAVFTAVSVLAATMTAVIALAFGMSWQQAAFLPLLLAAAPLVARSTPSALCFIAFSIMPLGVVQQEVAGVTLNVPEVLILALVAKEGLLLVIRRESVAPAMPLVPLVVFAFALTAGVGAGLIHGNGTVAVLQDFRQFSEFIVLFLLVVQCVKTREQARAIALCLVLGAAFIATHGIVQQFTFWGISEKQIASDLVLHQGVRSGSFYGATALGGMMVLACGPAIGVLMSARRRNVKALMLLCIVLCVFAMIFTKTRGSWLGLFIALAVFGVAVRPTRKQLLGVGAVAVLFAALMGPLVVHRLATLADPSHDISLMDRAQYYAAAYQIGRAHPILGLGWGCYYDISEILKNEAYIRVPRPDAAALALLEESAATEATVHSAYLQLFVKSGALGVLGFFAIVLVWLERAWRARNARRDQDPAWALYAGVTGGLAGYLFHSTFENFFQWPVMAQTFWLLMGLSFALAPAADRPARYRAPLTVLGVGAVLFAVFMYACVQLERLHTDNYEQNVARALDEGDIEKARTVAQRATEVEAYAPMPKTVYGRVLLLAGEEEAALAQLRAATGDVIKGVAPGNQNTGVPYYFAPARLTLGKHFSEQSDWVSAVENFELARSVEDLKSDDYADFFPVLYSTYAKRARWSRALEFGMPGDEEQASLPGSSLVQMGQVLAGRQQWGSLETIADALIARGEHTADASFFKGRVALGNADSASAIAHLTSARAAGHPEAAYFLGVAWEASGESEKALEAFAAVPGNSVLHTMALARSAAIARDEATRTALRAQLNAAITSMNPVQRATADTTGTMLVGWTRNQEDVTAGIPFPLLLLWEETQAPTGASTTLSITADNAGQAVAHLGGSNRVLQLQWVENAVNWESIERSYPGDSALPGWIDAGRDWFHLRTTPGFDVARDESGETALQLSELSWMFSAPLRVNAGGACLVLGRLQDPGANAAFGWQMLDADSNVLTGVRENAPVGPEGWMSYADYVVAGKDAEALRLFFETRWPVGAPARLDDVAVIHLSPPAPESADSTPHEGTP